MSDMRIESGTVESNRRRDGRSPRVRDETGHEGRVSPDGSLLLPVEEVRNLGVDDRFDEVLVAFDFFESDVSL